MRRIATALATFLAAGLTALAVPHSAVAAEGVLVINGVRHENPSGCAEIPHTSFVENYTDTPAYLHHGPGCSGEILFAIDPGQAMELPPGHSISIQ